MSNKLLFSKQARNKMLEGVDILSSSVKVTLGPKGRNVVIEQDFGSPLIVNDGVTIAKSIELKDKFQNLGSKILIEAASKTNDLVGDGTTTAIILASTLIKEGLKELDSGVNPVLLRTQLNKYQDIIINKILEVSTPVESLDDLEKIATISSASVEVGKMIKDAYSSVGKNGIITIEESQGLEDYLDVVKGYFFDKGFTSSYMANNDTKTCASLDNPLVLITDKKILSMQELLPFFEVAIKHSKPLFILCDDIEQEVLGAVVLNKLRGVFNAVVVKAPSFGERKLKQLEDIATITKSKIVDSSIGMDLQTSNIDVLGSAEKIIVTKDRTIITCSENTNIDSYILHLQDELSTLTSDYEKEVLSSRIAKLMGGIAQIKAGAETEVVLKEKKLRIEDAINATRAAMQSGIIDGAGSVLYNIATSIENDKELLESPSKRIIVKTLKQPFIQICKNAAVSYEKILEDMPKDMWYDALNDKYVNLKQAGIIDPASVEISAIRCAISLAGIFLTTECAIVCENEKNEVSEEDLV